MRGFWGAVARLRATPDVARLRTVVVVIAILQAGVLGLLARRGSWLSDDLEFLAQGSRGFAPHELLTPLNDHIAPGLRFVYAVFAKVAPLNHDFTVAWRIVLQALAIMLMGLLLLRLAGSSWWVVSGTVLYAGTPLSMPSFMSLSSGVNNLPSHVFGLLVLHATLDWYAGRRHRAVAYGPLSLLVSLMFWEKSALILLTVVALALYLRDRPLRHWLRQTWLFGLALAAPVVAFGVLYAVHRRPADGAFPRPGELVDLTVRSFAVPVTALVGGPWHWRPIPVFGVAAAPTGAVVLGALVMAILLTVAWRTDRRALLLWGAVGAYVLTTLMLVAYGRFELFGSIFTTHYHYWSDLSIPLTLAVVLTALRVQLRPRFIRWAPAVGVCCLLAWTTGAVASDAEFARSWDDNPARSYFATLTAELDQAGPAVNLWDTMMPPTVTTSIATDQRLSPVLRAARIPVNIQAPGSEPYVIDQTGRLRPATFQTWSTAVLPRTGDKFCDLLLHGVDSVTLPLRSALGGPLAEARWFARIGYFSNRETRLEVELIDAAGRELPMPVPSTAWPAGVSTMYFGPTAAVRAEAVRFRSTDPATNVCVVNVAIGLPEAER